MKTTLGQSHDVCVSALLRLWPFVLCQARPTGPTRPTMP